MLVPEHVGEGGEVVGQVGAVGRFNGDTLADDWFWHWGLSTLGQMNKNCLS